MRQRCVVLYLHNITANIWEDRNRKYLTLLAKNDKRLSDYQKAEYQFSLL